MGDTRTSAQSNSLYGFSLFLFRLFDREAFTRIFAHEVMKTIAQLPSLVLV